MEITAQDGKTKETVTVKVNTGSSDATLKALAISAGTLAPAFDAKTTAYTDAAPAGTTSVKVTPTVNAGNAKVTVDGKLNANGITVRGSIVGTRLDLQESLDFAGDGKVKATISTAGLDDINAVFDRMRQGQIEGRVVLDMTQ